MRMGWWKRLNEKLDVVMVTVKSLKDEVERRESTKDIHIYDGVPTEIIEAINRKLDRIDQEIGQHPGELRDRYNEILAEMNEVKNRMACLTGIHGEVKGLISATNKQIAELREALTETDDTYLADLKAVIAERLAGNEETPLSTVELAELAEAAKKVAEAEEMTERRKAQGRRGAEFAF